MKYFHHPFELDEEPRLLRLRRSMWLEGMGIFWHVFEKRGERIKN